jgi:hypothetical protein
MEDEGRKVFRIILSTLAEETNNSPTPYFLEYPRFFFMQAFSLLKQNGIETDYYECLSEFLEFLKENRVRIDYRTRRKMEEAIKKQEKKR